MATAQKKSVYTKLINVRQKFNESEIKKSGKNDNLEFLYLELKDIVPTATKLMQEEGLVSVVTFDEQVATMTIFNNDDKEDFIEFKIPFRILQPILSKAGKQVQNEVQSLGSSITYFRRYLYMVALDIAVPDEINSIGSSGNLVIQNANVYESKSEKPKTQEERKAIVEQMTKTNSQVPKEALEVLKELCIKLRKEQGDKYVNLITEISLKTQAFSSGTEEMVQTYLEALNEALTESAGN